MNTDQIIAEQFINSNLNEAVQIIEKLDDPDIAEFIQEIPVALSSKIFGQMNNYKVAKCLELLPDDFVVEVIKISDLLSTEMLLRQCDTDRQKLLLDKIPPRNAKIIREKLQYSLNSVGAVMNPNVFSLKNNLSIGEAMEIVKKEKDLSISEVFVINENRILEGLVRIEDLVLANSEDHIESILIKDIPRFFAESPVESLIHHPLWSKYRVFSVIDHSGVLIGSLHFDDVINRNLNKDKELNKRVVDTGNALGELYRIGVTGFLQSIGK